MNCGKVYDDNDEPIHFCNEEDRDVTRWEIHREVQKWGDELRYIGRQFVMMLIVAVIIGLMILCIGAVL